MKIGFLGAGSWGITLANLLVKKGNYTILWEHRPERCKRLKRERKDTDRFGDFVFPDGMDFTSRVEEILDVELLVFAVPSQSVRETARKIKGLAYPNKILSVVKGIEISSLKRMSEVIAEELGNVKISVLSGPSIAREVLKELPTSVVVASEDIEFAEEIQRLFSTNRFRVYRWFDVKGVELGGALKNVIAIAAGAVDSLKLGANAKGALITRGIAEITRLGMALGADNRTFAGLSGIGDLITTCFSGFSRNRYVGEKLGMGMRLKDILDSMVEVAEGVYTAEAAYKLSKIHNVSMPITEAVYKILHDEFTPMEALDWLMSRELKLEHY